MKLFVVGLRKLVEGVDSFEEVEAHVEVIGLAAVPIEFDFGVDGDEDEVGVFFVGDEFDYLFKIHFSCFFRLDLGQVLED